MATEKDDFGIDFYFAMRKAAGSRVSRDQKRIEKKKLNRSKPFDPGRDPIAAKASIDGLFEDFRWESQLEEAELFIRWADVVGEINAKNSQPESLNNSRLLVRCKSTAWATQLRLMQQQILERIAQEFKDLKVESIAFVGPDAPSWKKGSRSVPGRGPRDTYG